VMVDDLWLRLGFLNDCGTFRFHQDTHAERIAKDRRPSR
jgi:hypothetical protein